MNTPEQTVQEATPAPQPAPTPVKQVKAAKKTGKTKGTKPTAKTAAKPVAKPAAKAVKPKAPARDAKKAPAGKPAAADKKALPPKAAKPGKAAEPAEKKVKLVRDSYTMPKDEYAVLGELKERSAKLGRPVKKSELLRAGVLALKGLSEKSLLAALNAVPTIKTGRPRKN